MILALWLALAPASQAETYSADHMLRTESLGAVSLSPDERIVLFERFGPYDSADRFDLSYLGRWNTSTVWITSSEDDAPPRPFLAPEERRGVILGAWSPSGRLVLLHRLRDGRWETGVAEAASGDVRWLGVGAEPPLKGETALWRSDDELILLVRVDRGLPYELAGVRDAERETQTRRDSARGGSAATTVWGAGAYAQQGFYAAPTEVLHVDLPSGRQTVIDRGQGVDLALSHDGRWLSLVSRGPLNPVDLASPLRAGDPAEQRRLAILDLATGQRWAPCGECDVAAGLLAWEPQGDRLLYWVRDASRVATEGRLLAADAVDRSLETFDLGALEPDVAAHRDANFSHVRADWMRGRPIILARTPGQVRADWFRITPDGPKTLTGGLPAAPGPLEAITDDRLLLFAAGTAWSIDDEGLAVAVGPVSVAALPPITHWASPRLRFNAPPRRSWMPGRDEEGTIWRLSGDGRAERLSRLEAGAGVAASGRGLLVETHQAHGVETLRLRRTDLPARDLAVINPWLSGVSFADRAPVVHTGSSGEALTSWLYTPPGGLRPGTPVIVVAYPGDPERREGNPAEFNAMTNVELLAGLGYAVLAPTLPRLKVSGPAEGLTAQVLAVLDAAQAQYPDLDTTRTGYLGHSFGGYAGLVLAGETDRIRSYVILSASANLASAWGGFSGFARANPEFGISSRRSASWSEHGQGAIGGPPWTDPNLYQRNSPIFRADRITAPVLLIHGELDFVPVTEAESVFTALWRQNKDVQLVTYWGEHHIFYSPGTIRDLWTRIDAWFGQTLGVSPARLKPAPGGLPSDAPRPRPTPPPGSPPLPLASADDRPAAAPPSRSGR